MYEIGFKQEIAYRTAIDLTIFYRDTRDWVGISTTIKKYPVGNYRKYENKDYCTWYASNEIDAFFNSLQVVFQQKITFGQAHFR